MRRINVAAAIATIICVALAMTGSAQAGTIATRVLGQPDFTHKATNTLSGGALSFPGNHASGAVAVDVVNGHVYVADTGNSRILGWESVTALATGQFPNIVIGQVDFESAVAGTSASNLESPNGVAVDGAGNVYVADTGNSRVLMFPNPFTAFTNNGQFSNFAATVVLGQVGNFASGSCDVDTSGPNSETLCGPQGVAVDSDNNVWIADTGNNRVVEFSGPVTADSYFENEVFGQLGSFTAKTANNGGISKNSLNQPTGVAVDAHGNLYVADTSNNRVLEFNTPLGTTAVPGSGDTSADEVWGQAGSFTTSSCGTESATTLCVPTKVAVDASNNLYVGDTNNNRALMFNESNPPTNVSPNVILGQSGATTNACPSPPTASSLCFPLGVATASSGNLFVVDGGDNRVLEYAAPLASGAAATIVLGQTDFIHKNENVVTAASLNIPEQIALDPSTGGLYVADTANNRVLGWRSAADFTNFQPAALVVGQPDFESSGLDINGSVSANGFASPSGVAVDSNGNLYVGDYSNSRVLEFNAPFAACAGKFPCVAGSANLIFGQPTATSFACDAGGSTTASTLCLPKQLAVDKFNNLWVADDFNSRVLEYYTPLATTSVVGSGDTTADFVLGQGAAGNSFTTSNCETVSATSLCSPIGVAVDSSGNVWVGDSANNRVLEYNETVTAISPASNATANTVFGEGGSFTSSAGVNIGPNSLDGPQGLIVDGNGNLFVNDVVSDRVLEFFSPLTTTSTPGSGDTTADVVFGQGGDFVSNAPNGAAGPTNETLDLPLSVMVDAANSLYISDQGNSRILAYPLPYNPPGNNETPPPTGVLSLSRASLRFDDTAVGESRTREVTLSNAGSTQVALGAMSAAGEFTLGGNCGAILLPGQTCALSVTFAPMLKGRRGGMAYINDNANGAPHLVRLIGHATARRRHR